MKAKGIILLLIVVLLTLMFTSIVRCIPTVEVAIYFESANINDDEKAFILKVLAIVNGRFVDQLGIGLNFEVVGSWESDKNATDDSVLLTEAIRETNGIWTRVVDNIDIFEWKFYHPPHIVGIYFIDQPLKVEDEDVVGMADIWCRAAIVRFYEYEDKLAGIAQHELSHLFGILNECNEKWCCMNYACMPYRIWLAIWIIYEDYADEWGPECKQTLIQCYYGTGRTYPLIIFFQGCDSYYEYTYFTWSDSYHNWNLTSNRLRQVVHVKYNPRIKNSVHAVIASAHSFK